MEFVDNRNNLRRIRQTVGMHQRQLAALAGVSYQSVNKHENGRCGMSLEIARRYARALKCKVDDLIDEVSPSTRRFSA